MIAEPASYRNRSRCPYASKTADDSNRGFGQSVFIGDAGTDTALEHEVVRHFPLQLRHQQKIGFSAPHGSISPKGPVCTPGFGLTVAPMVEVAPSSARSETRLSAVRNLILRMEPL